MTDWIDRSEKLLRLADDVPDVVGVDTEFMRISTFYPRLALVQVARGDDVSLIDPVADIDLAPLGDVLADPARVTVMHSASEDLEAIATRLPGGIGRLFDTQVAAAFAGLGAGLGYQRLVQELLGLTLDKGETRSDWLRRPLSDRQLEYAAQDVVYLPELFVLLTEQVQDRGYSDWLAADCARMTEKTRRREGDSDPQLALRGAAEWPRERQALLRRLLLWREATARRTDTPRPWILDDASALDLASRPPASVGELAERTKGTRGLRREIRAELFERLHEPLADDELSFAPIPRAPFPRERPQLAALKEVVSAKAEELALPEGLLCARRHLESVLVTGEWPAALDGWRREVLHDALMTRLADLRSDA